MQLTDENVFEITRMLYTEFRSEQQEKKLDEDNLDEFKQKFIKPLYPHKVDEDDRILKYECSEYCCQLDPGRFCCCSSTPPDDQYRDFGLGVCLYVKFLKHITVFLFFMCFLAALALLLYYGVAINVGYNIVQNYQNFIFSGTTGIMASQFSHCEYFAIEGGNSATFTLECDAGEVSLLGAVLSAETLNSLKNCRGEIDKFQGNIYGPEGYSEDSVSCTDSLNQCNVTVSFTSNQYKGETFDFISYGYECINSEYQIGSLNLKSAIVTYIVIGLDFLIIIFFLFFLCSESKAENEEQFYFRTKQVAINDFSVKIDGFTVANIDNQLDYFIKGFEDESDEFVQGQDLLSNIVQIKVPESQEIRTAIERRRNAYAYLYQLIDQIFFDQFIDLTKYTDHEDFIRKCYGTVQAPQYLEYKKLLEIGVNQFLQSKKVHNKSDKDIPVSVIMVLNTLKYKRRVMRQAKQRCFKKILSVQGRDFQVNEAPVADMIIWENSHKWTCCRVLFVWLLTLSICFGSYLLVGLAQYKKQTLNSANNFGEDCQLYYTNSQLKDYDTSLENENQYHDCYCDYHKFQVEILRNQCYDWAISYGTYLAIPILISLGIVLYNLIISRFFRLMTKFQAHTEVTAQLYSYIIKRSFVLVMNMGLIMILLKLEYQTIWNDQNLYFLFLGTYYDITADWYLQIGVVITFTLGFNIFIPIIEMMFLSFLKCVRKCVDRRCYCRKTSQKTKKGYLQLYLNDVFPLEERYADIIAIIIITLAFSGVMPGLYIIAFFSLLFMVLSDKLLLFKVYQKPINYTASLQSKIYKTIYITLIIHCITTIVLMSQPHLVAAGTLYQVSIVDIIEDQRFSSIVRQPYLIAYLVLLILLLLWGLLNATIISFIKFCSSKCKKGMSVIHKEKLKQNFYQSLNTYQINRLKMSMERQLHKNITHTKSKLKLEVTEGNLLRSQKKHLREIVCQQTYEKLMELEGKAKSVRAAMASTKNNNNSNNHNNYVSVNNKSQQAKLIGHAGYQEIFDDEIFNRERKIKMLDSHLGEIVGRRPKSNKSKALEIEDIELNIEI